jgi:hypothetical protein
LKCPPPTPDTLVFLLERVAPRYENLRVDSMRLHIAGFNTLC